jgi:hypothetical protein
MKKINMDMLTFISNIINSLSWPIATIVLVWLLKAPLSKLLLLIVKIKFKDLEIWFKEEMQSIKSEVSSQELPKISEEEDSHIKEIAQKTPVLAILNAWKDLEKTIYNKLKELFPKGSLQLTRLTPDRACTELFLTNK